MKLSLLVVFLSVLNIQCTKNKLVESGVKTQTLHLGNGSEPADLDPHIVTGVPEHYIISSLFEGLINLDQYTLQPVPGIAESWELSPDQKQYTFHIRKDAKWSNGQSITTKDVEYSWKRLLSPELGAEYAYFLFYVVNAEKYQKGELKDFSQVGIKVIDDYAIQVTLNNPTPFFLTILCHYSTYPVPKETIEKFGKATDRGTAWTKPGNIVTSGPFKLAAWELNKVIRVVKSDMYWDKNKVKLNEINFYPIEKQETEEKKFRSGDLHVSYDVPLEKIDTYKKKNPEVLNILPYLGNYFYRLNVTKPPMNNLKVRQALAMSIDRDKIVNFVTKGGQLPAYNLTPPNTAGYTATAKIEFNVEKARQLLAEAGYPNGKGFPSVDLLYNTSENHKSIAEAIQQMWKENLNIEIKLLNQDWKVYLKTVQNLDYQMARAGWIGDYADPNNFLDMFVTGGGNNNTGFASKTYDENIRLAGTTLDQEKRFEYFQKAEKELMEQVPIIPIYVYTRIFLKHSAVKNWPTNIISWRDYKEIHLEEAKAE